MLVPECWQTGFVWRPTAIHKHIQLESAGVHVTVILHETRYAVGARVFTGIIIKTLIVIMITRTISGVLE
jgi:hypothetical protein